VYNCENSISKIEYLGVDGKVVLTCVLSGYKPVADGFRVPGVIEVVARRPDGKDDLVRISLRTLRPVDFSARQQGLFSRPAPRGFSRVVQIVEGEFIEQKP
jgi:hypothetical protein